MLEKFVKIFIFIIAVVLAYNIYIQVKNGNIATKQKEKRLKKIMPKNPALIETMHERLSKLNAFSGDPVFIRIFKKEAILELWIKPQDSRVYKLLKIYPICKYSGHLGPKLKEGDKQAPEGFYIVNKRSLNPNSRFHLSFNLGYPNAYDRAYGRTGSYLMVHGSCASVGCYAMGDRNIEDIYSLVSDALNNGQKSVQVHIFPFKMEHLKEYKNSKWYSFWKNLKEGYDIFNAHHIPPKVSVVDKEYRFSY